MNIAASAVAAGSLDSPMAHNELAWECEIAAAAAVLDGTVNTGQTRLAAGGNTAEAPQPGAVAVAVAAAALTKAHTERRLDARPEEKAQSTLLDVVDIGRHCEYRRHLAANLSVIVGGPSGRSFQVPHAR